jgi:hypothetical protein
VSNKTAKPTGLVNAGKREKSERREAKKVAERGRRRDRCREKKYRTSQERLKD